MAEAGEGKTEEQKSGDPVPYVTEAQGPNLIRWFHGAWQGQRKFNPASKTRPPARVE